MRNDLLALREPRCKYNGLIKVMQLWLTRMYLRKLNDNGTRAMTIAEYETRVQSLEPKVRQLAVKHEPRNDGSPAPSGNRSSSPARSRLFKAGV